MRTVSIPTKCDRCHRRKPTIAILGKNYSLFVCDKCRGIGR